MNKYLGIPISNAPISKQVLLEMRNFSDMFTISPLITKLSVREVVSPTPRLEIEPSRCAFKYESNFLGEVETLSANKKSEDSKNFLRQQRERKSYRENGAWTVIPFKMLNEVNRFGQLNENWSAIIASFPVNYVYKFIFIALIRAAFDDYPFGAHK